MRLNGNRKEGDLGDYDQLIKIKKELLFVEKRLQ